MMLARLVELARRGLEDEAQGKQRRRKATDVPTMTEVWLRRRYLAEQTELDNLAAAAATEDER